MADHGRPSPVNRAAFGGGGWRGEKIALIWGMKTFLTILVGIAMLATLGVLLAGMVGMVRGGGDPRRSNKLMQWRVALQALTLVLFALLLTLLKS
jgi:hypothetical protein